MSDRSATLSKNGKKCTESERFLISLVLTAGQTLHLPGNLTFGLVNIESVDMPDSIACLLIVSVESAPVARKIIGMDIAVSVHCEVVVQPVQFILGGCVLLDRLQIDRFVQLCPFGSGASEVV